MKLTPEQIQQFDELGYLKLPQAIAPQTLAQLIQGADDAQQFGFDALKRNEVPKDYAFNYQFLTPFLNRLTQYHLYSNLESLAVLGSPEVLDAACSLCGDNFLPTVDMLILKNQYDNLDLPWHQDLIYDWKKYRVIALGIYLEDAKLSDGALKLVKDSQYERHDIDHMMQDETLEVFEIAAKAGDIVIHNPMLVHWSDKLENQTQRRTLYYEFRPMSQVINQEHWPEKVVTQRLGILAKAMSQFRSQNPEKQAFILPDDHPLHHFNGPEDLTSLYHEPIPFNTANFAKSLLDQLAKKNQ